MKPICIASLNGISNVGGVERVTQYLVDMLKDSYEVRVVKRLRVSFGKYDDLIQAFILSFRLLFTRKSIVISNSWHSFLYPADLSIHHGTMKGVGTHTESFSGKSRCIAWMESLSGKLAKKNLAVSENCKSELIDYYHIEPSRIDILNNFVDESIFYPRPRAKDSGAMRVVFAGSLCSRKGLPELIAFARYIETRDDVELRIASNDRSEFCHFERLRRTKILPGMGLAEMPDFYNEADVLFYPTRYEGFSMATLEALATGIPVVGTGFAIARELRDYEFCHVMDGGEVNHSVIVDDMRALVTRYGDKREEIHRLVSQRFGKNAYRTRLFEYVTAALNKEHS